MSSTAEGSIYRRILGRLTGFKVEHWGETSGQPSLEPRNAVDLEQADVVSSLVKDSIPDPVPTETWDDLLTVANHRGKHLVVLDIDHPAALVPSTTAEHFHLLVEIPPCEWGPYQKFLEACAGIGLLEPGYVNASISRGHTDVRPSWVTKPVPSPEVPPL